MGKVKEKHRLDKYYRLAKERGYRSRASCKLIQIDAKYSLLRKSHAVLDLCAAPGGWMQVTVEKVPVGSLVLGIDLVPIIPVSGCVAMQQDITRPECSSNIKEAMEKHGVKAFDLILHDGSPKLGGAWVQEALAQNALVIDSVKLATEFLAPKGNLVTKVSRSRDYNSVLFCLGKFFEKVEVYKPPASRSSSAETYLLGLEYKAPAKIDPRLLDFRHLFKEAPPQEPTRKKRNHHCCEDLESIVRRVAYASDFIWYENPKEILDTVTCITFDNQASLPLKEHDLTTEKVKTLCGDLTVLWNKDLEHILKWRMQIREALTSEEKELDVENEDDRLLMNELEELTNAVDRIKKLLAKRRAKGKKDLMAVDNDEDDNANANDVENEASDDSKDSEDLDSDEEPQRYTEQMNETFEEAYDPFMVSAKQRKRYIS